MASQEDINKVIADVRVAIKKRKCTIVPRKKNLDTLARLGLTLEDAYDEICDLSATHYHDGPNKDRDDPDGDLVWIFKKTIFYRVVYIKFIVVYQIDGSVTVISFHLDNM